MGKTAELSILSCLLLIFWASRVIGIGVFTPFIDEALHVRFAEVTLGRNPIYYGEQGRIFTIWLYMLFRPDVVGGVWLARLTTLFAVVLGFSAIVGIGRIGGGLWGGLLAGTLYAFGKYPFFFDRMALADTVAGAFTILGIYFIYRMARRLDLADAVLGGFSIFVAIGAKLSALPYIGVPIAGLLSMNPRRGLVLQTLRWGGVALGTAVLPTSVLLLGLIGFGHDPFGLVFVPGRVAGANFLDNVVSNLMAESMVITYYLGRVYAILLLISIGYLLSSKNVYLLLCLIPPLLVLWLSAWQSSRFLYQSMAIIYAIIGVAFAMVTHGIGVRMRWVLFGALVAWALLIWVPVAVNAFEAPDDLPLLPRDYMEYISSDASGFGLQEVLGVLAEQGAQNVLGLLSNCQGLRYMAAGEVVVSCPRINPNGQDVERLELLMEQSRQEGLFVVLERGNYVPSDAPGMLVAVIERPRGGPELSIYDLSP